MKKSTLAVVALVIVAASVFSYLYVGNRGFTPWMSLGELDAFMKTFEAKHPGELNYWDQGNWITAVDARWHDAAPQYRIRYASAPKGQGYSWYWHINQDQASFSKMMRQYSDEGYLLAHSSACTWPDGTVHYQAVWHRYGKKKVSSSASSVPAGSPLALMSPP